MRNPEALRVQEEFLLNRIDENLFHSLIVIMVRTSADLPNTYQRTLFWPGAKQVFVIKLPAMIECLTVTLIGADGFSFLATILYEGLRKEEFFLRKMNMS